MLKQNQISTFELNILKLLINHPFLTLEQISYFLNRNNLTIKKYITSLNRFLKDNNLGNILYVNKTFVFKKLFNNITISRKKNIIYSSEERIYYITLLLIFEEKISLKSLTGIFNITQGTLLNDLRKLRLSLEPFNLKVETLSWVGIKLSGKTFAVNAFSIEFLIKYIVEKDSNNLTWMLYTTHINPLIERYITSKITDLKLQQIDETVTKILTELNLKVDLYSHSTLKSTLIFCYIKKVDLEVTKSRYFSTEKINTIFENQKKILYNLLEEKDHKFKYKITCLLSYVITHLRIELQSLLENDYTVEALVTHLKKFYNIVLSDSDLCLLIRLVKIFRLKKSFNIYSYSYYFIYDSDVPKNILKNLKKSLEEVNFKFLDEDYFSLTLFIYQIICKYYIELSRNKSFLIFDSSFENWITKGFKNELKKYLPDAHIEIYSIYKNKSIEKNYSEFDYIISMNNFEIENLPKLDNKKIVFINYKDHFEINNFWTQLFFKEKE